MASERQGGLISAGAAVQQALVEARFVSEVLAVAGAMGVERSDIELELHRLASEGGVVLATHAAPDVHLRELDLTTVAYVRERTVAGMARARAEADQRWNVFLRDFLGSHRCG